MVLVNHVRKAPTVLVDLVGKAPTVLVDLVRKAPTVLVTVLVDLIKKAPTVLVGHVGNASTFICPYLLGYSIPDIIGCPEMLGWSCRKPGSWVFISEGVSRAADGLQGNKLW